MFANHAECTAIKTQEPFQNQVITEKCWPNLKHLQPELPMAQLQNPTGTFQCLWALPSSSLLTGENSLKFKPIPSAFKDSCRAQQQWHRLILKDHRDKVWMSQPSPGSPPSPNIPGTPPAAARRGPASLSTHRSEESEHQGQHTHTQTHYLGWGLHSHQDYKNKHNTIKMGISSSSLSPSHPFPVPTHISYYFPEPSKSIWTTQDKIRKGSIGQVNLQKYELFWCDHCYRGDNRVLGHRGSISLCWLLLLLPAVLPLDGTFQRGELQPYTPKLQNDQPHQLQ